MTRLLSGAVLVGAAVALVWLATPAVFFVFAEATLVLAFIEYRRLAEAVGLPVPAVAGGIATVAASVGVSSWRWIDDTVVGMAIALDAVLMSALIVLAMLALASWRGGRDAIGRASAATFPLLYLGLPTGALIAIRQMKGSRGLFLLMLTVIVSDTAQYYTGRRFGRRQLAPEVSPKKTIEGAIGGFVFGTLLLTVVGRWWLPDVPLPSRVVLGDLFESMLKRSAGVKDSSSLIPGHGGVLDRLDALLFAAPVYYLVLKYV